jgi:hypothetical protein
MNDTMWMSNDERMAHYEKVQGLKLSARVEATNAANRYAMELRPKLAAALRPFVGCKVFKVDGSLTKAVESALPKLPNEPRLHVRRNGGSMSWVVQVSVYVPEYQGRMSHDAYVYVGDVRGGVLENVNDKPLNLRTDYTAGEVQSKRAEYKRLKKLADEALSALSHFGEFDR